MDSPNLTVPTTPQQYSKRCPSCFKNVEELYLLTGEDVLRTRNPEISVCEECREAIRGAARLGVTYPRGKAIRDFLLTVPIITILVVLISDVVLANRTTTLGGRGVLYFITAIVLFTGAGQVWAGLKDRYGYTNNLDWSIRSRRVVIGLGTIASCVLIVIMSFFLSLVGGV